MADDDDARGKSDAEPAAGVAAADAATEAKGCRTARGREEGPLPCAPSSMRRRRRAAELKSADGVSADGRDSARDPERSPRPARFGRRGCGQTGIRGPAIWLVAACVLLAIAIHGGRSRARAVDPGSTTGLRTGCFSWDLRANPAGPSSFLTLLLYFRTTGSGPHPVGAAARLAVLARARTVEPLLRLVVALGRNPRRDLCVQARLGEAGTARRAAPRQGRYRWRHIRRATSPTPIVLWGLADWSVSPLGGLRRRWVERSESVAGSPRWRVTVGMILLNYHWLSDFLGGRPRSAVVVLAGVLWPGWEVPARAGIDARAGLRSFATHRDDAPRGSAPHHPGIGSYTPRCAASQPDVAVLCADTSSQLPRRRASPRRCRRCRQWAAGVRRPSRRR